MRLITRGDLDGLACAAIISSHEELSDIVLAHPQDVVRDRIAITEGDIVANLPYHPDCARWFDHRLLTGDDPRPPRRFSGRHDPRAPSAARLVWQHYGSEARFGELVRETDRLDSAQLTERDVLEPTGHVLLGFTLDARSGLGEFRYYFHRCLGWVKSMPIEDVLEQPLVRNRVERMASEREAFAATLRECSRVDGSVVVTDLRSALVPPVGNRFIVYTVFPKANVSLRVHWGPGREFVVLAVAHSIFNHTSTVSAGELMARWGGGGHRGAGAAPVETAKADAVIAEIVATLNDS